MIDLNNQWFSSETHMCTWNGKSEIVYKRQTKVHGLCVPICVCLDRTQFGDGSGSRRDGEGCVVYRYSHGRVFAAIFGPFPFGARGAFTVHTSYVSPSSATSSHPRVCPYHPRVMDTQGVGDYANEVSRPYGWRFMCGP